MMRKGATRPPGEPGGRGEDLKLIQKRCRALDGGSRKRSRDAPGARLVLEKKPRFQDPEEGARGPHNREVMMRKASRRARRSP